MKRGLAAVAPLALAAGAIADPSGGLGVPCLWRVVFGVTCPGCGLSRAGVLLVQGRIFDAADMNVLIFAVAAAVAWSASRMERRF